MKLRPDIGKLMWREIYTLLTISISIILGTLIIQGLVVNLDPDVNNAQFVKFVWSWVAGFIIVFWVFVPWLIYFWIINLQYSIEDERLVINKGIITKKNVSIPYSAITDFTLSRSLYERWLEIGTILIQTAGQSTQPSGYEGKLEGLVECDSIHTALRAKVKAFRGVKEEKPELEASTEVDVGILQEILDEVRRINRKLT